MDKVFILSLSALSSLTYGQTFYVSTNSSNLSEAKQLCNLATPGIPYNDGKYTLRLSLADIEGQISEDDELWIGYRQFLAAFLYKGCTATSNIPANVKRRHLAADPGHCFSFCETSMVGIEENTCYCITSLPDDIKGKECNSECEQPKHTLCGKKGKGVSIYKNVQYHPTSMDLDRINDEHGLCRAFEPKNGYYFWKSCDTQYHIRCERGNKVPEEKYFYKSSSGSWRGNNGMCLQYGYYPAEEAFPPVPWNQTTTEVWTGRLRSKIISSKTLVWVDPEQGNKQGFVTYKDEEFQIHFTDKDNHRRRALCIKDSTPSEEAKSSNLVAVYVLVPMVLLLVVVSLIIVFLWRRRKSNAETTTDNSKTFEQSQGEGKTYDANYKAGLQEDSPGDTIDGIQHNYMVLEPASEYAVIHEADLANINEDYDTTNPVVVNGDRKETDNIYNKLKDQSDDTYNHTNDVGNKFDDTYNHAGEKNVETAYDTTEASGKFNIKAAAPEDVQSQTIKSDDAYSHLHEAF